MVFGSFAHSHFTWFLVGSDAFAKMHLKMRRKKGIISETLSYDERFPILLLYQNCTVIFLTREKIAEHDIHYEKNNNPRIIIRLI